jgi:chemotaxis signal transduction protein
MNESQQFCTFYVDEHCFGVSVDKVQEVLRSQPMTSVPLAPQEVCGLINLRGQIVTVIDLRRCLNLPDREQPGGTNVIVQTGDDIVSLLVDEMGNVEYVNEAEFELPPETMRGDQRELIKGTCKLPDKLMLILDVAKVVVSEKIGQAP